MHLNAKNFSKIESFKLFPIDEKEHNSYIENIYNDIFETPEGRELSESSKTVIHDNLLPSYVRASKIAKYYQKLYYASGLLAYTFSAASVAAVATAILLPSTAIFSFSIELVLLLSIFAIVVFAHRKQAHKNWIENRFLAERIRSAVFFAACGMETPTIKVPTLMRLAHHPNDWMIRVYDEVWARTSRMEKTKEGSLKIYVRFIRKQWIQDQIKFHIKKAETTGLINHRLEFWGKVVFSIAIAAVTLHLYLPFLLSLILSYDFHNEWVDRALTFFALVMPAIGASIGGFRVHRELSRLSMRSNNMAIALRERDAELSRISSVNNLESLLSKTDELMLREMQDWLMLMRFTELETVA